MPLFALGGVPVVWCPRPLCSFWSNLEDPAEKSWPTLVCSRASWSWKMSCACLKPFPDELRLKAAPPLLRPAVCQRVVPMGLIHCPCVGRLIPLAARGTRWCMPRPRVNIWSVHSCWWVAPAAMPASFVAGRKGERRRSEGGRVLVKESRLTEDAGTTLTRDAVLLRMWWKREAGTGPGSSGCWLKTLHMNLVLQNFPQSNCMRWHPQQRHLQHSRSKTLPLELRVLWLMTF